MYKIEVALKLWLQEVLQGGGFRIRPCRTGVFFRVSRPEENKKRRR
jgi:hypothetical protein